MTEANGIATFVITANQWREYHMLLDHFWGGDDLTPTERVQFEALRFWYLGGFGMTEIEKAKAMEWVVKQYLEDMKANDR